MMTMVEEVSCDIRIESDAWREIDAVQLAERCFAAFRAAHPDTNGAPSILFTDDAVMRDLNAQYRGKDKATNVLSFPAGNTAYPEAFFLGDIALGFGVCAGEARQNRISLSDHTAHLLIHGMLHLIGYDHQNEDEALLMETQETAILESMGVAAPYEDAGGEK